MGEIKTPLRYPGGKIRAAEMLISSAPYFEEYREPFIGGGSVFIKMKQKIQQQYIGLMTFIMTFFASGMRRKTMLTKLLK